MIPHVRVTDDNMIPIGDPIEQILSLSVTPQYRAAGAGTITLVATPDVIDAVMSDRARIDVINDGVYIMGGPVEQNAVDWDAKSSPGVVTLSFSDDLSLIAAEQAYPDPAHASTAQTAAQYAPGTISGETFMYDVVNLNVGPGAILARQIANLTLATPAGIGGTVTLSARFEPICDLLRRAAIAAGGLGFRTEVVGLDRRFVVYDPTNLSRTIRFTSRLNNLRTAHLEISKPTCNVAIVGDSGTGASRTIVERTDPASITRWGRVVQFVNANQTSVTAELQAAGDKALADGAERGQVAFTAVDTDDQRYGVDYTLGNIATCEPFPGLSITGVIRAVTLTYTPKDGVVISPLIGPDSAITDRPTLNVLRDIERRLGYSERS